MAQRFIVNLMAVVIPSLFAGGMPQAQAGIIDFLSEYRLGLDVSKAAGSINLLYKTQSSVPLDSRSCKAGSGNSYDCQGVLPIDSNYAPGVVFQTPFKRKGFFHYDLDIDFAIRSFEAKPTNFVADPSDIPPAGYGTPPLRQAAINLWGANADAYFEFGLTPLSPIPNLILALGFGLQPLYGTVQINDKKLKKFILNTLGYVEIDLVLARFGKAGEVTLYAQGEAGSTALEGVKIDGITDINLQFIKKSYGLTILTNFP